MILYASPQKVTSILIGAYFLTFDNVTEQSLSSFVFAFSVVTNRENVYATGVKSFWDTVDSVYVINLDGQQAKWEQFLADSPVPLEKLHRVSGVVGAELPGYLDEPWFTERTGERARKWAGAAGCLMAHRKVLELARERGDRLFAVLEDDALFSASPDTERLLARWMTDARMRRGLLYLGFHKMPLAGRRILTEGGSELWELPGVLTTHAYALSGEAAAVLLDEWPQGADVWEWLARYRAVDTWFREYLTARTWIRVYGVLPRWATQRPGVSDVSNERSEGTRPEKREKPIGGLLGWLGLRLRFCSRLKSRLNSRRTWNRARKGGFPGPKARTKSADKRN